MLLCLFSLFPSLNVSHQNVPAARLFPNSTLTDVTQFRELLLVASFRYFLASVAFTFYLPVGKHVPRFGTLIRLIAAGSPAPLPQIPFIGFH